MIYVYSCIIHQTQSIHCLKHCSTKTCVNWQFLSIFTYILQNTEHLFYAASYQNCYMLCGAFPYLVRYSGAHQQNNAMRNARKYPYVGFGQRRPISACANAQDDQDFPCPLTESGYSSICTSDSGIISLHGILWTCWC